MDAAKKQRKVQRTAFTKCLKSFEEKSANVSVTLAEKHVAMQLLESRMQELEIANSKVLDAMYGKDKDDTVIEAELDAHEKYKTNFLTAKTGFVELVNVTSNTTSSTPAATREKPFKRPMLEPPTFGGNVSKWLQFWSHFRKIHEDTTISKEDKLEYLKRLMEKGSRAENIVDGYPTTAANYDKAFESLKNRYGRDDLLIEYYTRELLTLALQNAVNKGKQVSISTIYDKISAQIRALETLGVKTNNCATMLYPLVESSLPEEILRTWQRVDKGSAASVEASVEADGAAAGNAAVPDRLTRLLKFLESEVDNEESIKMAVNGFTERVDGEKRDKTKENKGKTSSTDLPTASVLMQQEEKRVKCIFCDENHYNVLCEKAKKLSITDRNKIIKDNNCCFKCLRRGHISKKCKVKITCAWCGNRHSTLVCPDLCKSTPEVVPSKDKPKSDQEVSCTSICNFPDVYVKTLRFVLYSENREKIVRALIDDGAQRSYIRSDVAEFLGYEPIGSKETVHLLFGGVKSESQKHKVYLARMRSLENNFACNFQVLDQEVICADIPKITGTNWLDELKRKNISLSDLDCNDRNLDKRIDMLIGADVAGKLFTGNKFDLSNGLSALEYKLGWTIMGKVPEYSRQDDTLITFSMFMHEAKISDLWSLDVLGIKDPIEKSDRLIREQNVKESFLKTVILKENNRYSVDLPWIDDHAPLSNNFELSKKRVYSTAKKLKNDGSFNRYDEVLSDWRDQDIIEIVTEKKSNELSHFLPHRPVMKPGSTTEIRPIFDASASEQGKPSLNQCLEKGPNLIELIPATLLRFRENEIGVIADIQKAFLQIEINEKDRDYLRFLWFSGEQIIVYRHKRVVFGLTCSPFLLGAVLEFHLTNILHDEKKRFHGNWSMENVKKLAQSFYVDNCVTSVKSASELKSFISEARQIMAAGNFNLRGWEFTNDGSEKELTSVLGLVFDKSRDTLSINPALLQSESTDVITKRKILSAAHRVFDPIGFTAPVTLIPKLILKRVWQSKEGWDTPVAENVQKEFLQWYNQLHYLKDIKIPRKLGYGKSSIHTFCDASQTAYATVTFLRVEHEGQVSIRLLAAKARIAPEKTTIPRLELMGASIGSRQTFEILEALSEKNIPVFCWSDSTTVLTWLSRDSQWGTFLWNRVREIRQLSATWTWKYVPGELNPADLPSRGCQPKQLLDSHWWEGPDWLRETQGNWPILTEKTDEKEVNSEIRKSIRVTLLHVKDEVDYKIIDKFSSYSKMIRFFTIMYRFKNFLLNRATTGTLITYTEIHDIELKFLKSLQSVMFSSIGDPRLATLNAFVHSDGLIRLKTKITERNDSFPFLYPIVLDNKHKAIELLIRETHEQMCHAGVQTVMCHLREKFWILSMRKTVRSVINKCIICKRYNVKRMKAAPAPLPKDRVKDASVFEVTGVDFAGPVFLRGGQKGWICLFTCAVYRAVHIELVTSLSTQEFLGALRRFIGRRGRPAIIFSDNGTNFVGADNALKELNWGVISNFSSARRIDWRFNPPTASWWGGFWERLIGMLKNILRKVLGKACLSYEQLTTVLCDCEMTLNSRPLTYVSEESNDFKVITPAMFLNDLKVCENPDLDILDKINLKNECKRRQEVMEHLRNRFRKEYLSQLVSRNNDKNETRKLSVGDVVLIGDDQHKRLNWPLAVVQNLIPGRDGVSRVVVLKTKDGLFTRPIQRVYPLEISGDSNTNKADIMRAKSVKKPAVQPIVKKTPVQPIVKDKCKVEKAVVNDEPAIKTRSGRTVKKPKMYGSD